MRTSFGGFLDFPTLEREGNEKKLDFEEGLKIAAENKINGSNTWNLELIDYFADMTLLRDGDSINFQKASFTLDGCVKVYTSRIDSFESDTRKLMSGLDEEDSVADSSKPAKRRKQLAATLTDHASLSTDVFELDFIADPLFQKTAADFDEGGAKGLLLSHLDISRDGKVIFDASDSVSLQPAVPVISFEDVDIEELKCNYIQFDGSKIWSEAASFNNGKDMSNDFNMDENREDFYFNQIDELSDYEDAVPAVDFQFGGTQDFNDDFNDDPADFEMGTEEANVIQVEKGRMQKVERNVMRMVANTAVNQDQNMFQYFDTIPAPATDKVRAPAKKAVKVKIDFSGEDLDIDTVFKKSTTTINLPKSKAIEKDLHLLPPDFQFNSERLLKLFLKPDFKIHQVALSLAAYKGAGDLPKDQLIDQVDEEYFYGGFDEEYDDGPVDFPVFGDLAEAEIEEQQHLHTSVVEDIVPMIAPAISDEAEFDVVETVDDFIDQPTSQSFTQESLVKVESDISEMLILKPLRKRKIPLLFAKTAKRVDVSKLKENLWQKLSADTTTNVQIESEGDAPIVIQETSFAHIVSELDDCYPEKARKDISVAFCFICVLHLANENNLTITADGMKELTIGSAAISA